MANNINTGAFVPTTDVYDTQAIYDLDINSLEFKEFLVRLRQSTNNIALVLNVKDSGYYVLTEFVNSQLWFPNPILSSTTQQTPSYRQDFRLVIDFGALPNTGSKSVAHNISGIVPLGLFTLTRLYGAATDPIAQSYIPIPYASPTLANNIELSMDATNVTITTGSNRSNYLISYVIIEYLKQ